MSQTKDEKPINWEEREDKIKSALQDEVLKKHRNITKQYETTVTKEKKLTQEKEGNTDYDPAQKPNQFFWDKVETKARDLINDGPVGYSDWTGMEQKGPKA
ncbi:MAG: hypothetical protein H0U73_03800 [Tatlockia sp.]|nr:hypothetical protein [Tatlockia sp.]